MKKNIHEIEQRLRNGRLPDADLSQHRMKIWQRLVAAKRARRKTLSVFTLPPYIWALVSVAIILGFVIFIFYLRR